MQTQLTYTVPDGYSRIVDSKLMVLADLAVHVVVLQLTENVTRKPNRSFLKWYHICDCPIRSLHSDVDNPSLGEISYCCLNSVHHTILLSTLVYVALSNTDVEVHDSDSPPCQ